MPAVVESIMLICCFYYFGDCCRRDLGALESRVRFGIHPSRLHFYFDKAINIPSLVPRKRYFLLVLEPTDISKDVAGIDSG